MRALILDALGGLLFAASAFTLVAVIMLAAAGS